jgi:hypothetical protein
MRDLRNQPARPGAWRPGEISQATAKAETAS